MKKKVIRLTENDLHRIIKNTVNRVIKESKRNLREMDDSLDDYDLEDLGQENFSDDAELNGFFNDYPEINDSLRNYRDDNDSFPEESEFAHDGRYSFDFDTLKRDRDFYRS